MLWRIVCWSNTPTYTHANLRIYGVSFKTGNKLSVSQMSAVLTHHHRPKHTISDSDFTILTSGSSKFDLEMRESLLISKLKPILDFVLIFAHCFCNYLIIRPFLFEFLPFVI